MNTEKYFYMTNRKMYIAMFMFGDARRLSWSVADLLTSVRCAKPIVVFFVVMI